MSKQVLTKDERCEAALKIAVVLAKKVGAEKVSLAAVAAKMKVSAPLMFHIFGTSGEFRKQLVKAAKVAGAELPTATTKVKVKVKSAPKKMPTLAKPAPVKKAAPVKVAAKKVIKRAAALVVAKKAAPVKKVAALLSPKPVTSADKFKALPKPFEAALQQVVSTPAA